MSSLETIPLLVLALTIAIQIIVLFITKFSKGKVGRVFSFSRQIIFLVVTIFVYSFLLYANINYDSIVLVKIAHAIDSMIWSVIVISVFILFLCLRIEAERKKNLENKKDPIKHIDKRI